MKTTLCRCTLILSVLSCIALVNASAQVSSYKACTLFVYNFTKYIQWPEGAFKDEFIIGVFGKSPVDDELQKLVALKKAGNKAIRIVELSEINLASEVHILLIPNDEIAQITAILTAMKGKPVLLVDHNNLFELNASSIATQDLNVSKTLEALAFKSPSL